MDHKGLDCLIDNLLVGRFLLPVMSLVTLLPLGGCGAGTTAPGDPDPAPPSWLAELPRRTVEAAPGETVWAVVPELGNESAALGAYRLEASSGAAAVLVDGLGNRFEGVPAALVHPVSGFLEGELAAGAVVLASRWDADKVVGRVAGTGDGTIRVAYDWNGVTETGVMDAVVALPGPGESLVLRWVAYQPAGGAATDWYRGLCFAESDDRLWISDDGGYVEVVARDAVKVLSDLGRSDPQVGDTVGVYSWNGYRAGTVSEILEPELRYAVRFGDGETQAFFFEHLSSVR